MRSNFQAAIISLSFFALASRESKPRSLLSTILPWIPAIVLISGVQ